MKTFLFLFCCFAFQTVFAQKLLKGVVVDAEKGTPVPKASVFLSNTSIGTTAKDDGSFSLTIPAGKFELIASSIGYETHSETINASEATDYITIKLKPKAPELEAVIIEPYEKNGWERWGTWFIENFIGTSSYAQDCRIKNTGVLRFRNSKKTNTLTVTAMEPLVIENSDLGYRIRYQLESFSYNFDTHFLLYTGFPFFESMTGSDRKARKWQKAREDVYYGSEMQFMRAVYVNRIKEEGFDVYRLKKVANAEKARIKALYKRSFVIDDYGRRISTINRDSTKYYDRIMSESDAKDFVGKEALPGDSIAFALDSTLAGMDFSDYLLVIYTLKKAPYEYKQRYPDNGDAMMSQITLLNNKAIEIQANGSFYAPEDLLNSGYWGWSEKMGTMLPYDYEPPKK